MPERWLAVTEDKLSHYEVSDYGRVRNAKTKRVKVAQRNRNIRGVEYLCVLLWYAHARCKKRYVHRLVAAAFLARPHADATEVDHINTNPLDNRAVNLQWVTPAQNKALALSRSADER